ncbi:hypothetical protein [Phytopseudomonas daroniae]|uniref:hypothetical protein n=1 Tax=Phytopseudomonas daroniae TaxID=2487519 RepID=UPI0010384E4F|nr:hypothetical protein [Pseudomonas daroniae]TBU72265.1 hypothetical protein DNK10_22235 [Pseudomonas daroniae]
MHKALLLITLSILAACSSDPKNLYQEKVINSDTPIAERPADALLEQAIPLPTDPTWPLPSWEITAAEPRIKIKGSVSNYRIFSVELAANFSHRIKVNSWCVNACLGFKKYALTPYLILIDKKGQVLTEGFGEITGAVGSINQSLTGYVSENETYYLIVAADNRAPGETVLVDSVAVIGSTTKLITPLRISMGSYPFGKIAPYLSTSE